MKFCPSLSCWHRRVTASVIFPRVGMVRLIAFLVVVGVIALCRYRFSAPFPISNNVLCQVIHIGKSYPQLYCFHLVCSWTLLSLATSGKLHIGWRSMLSLSWFKDDALILLLYFSVNWMTFSATICFLKWFGCPLCYCHISPFCTYRSKESDSKIMSFQT